MVGRGNGYMKEKMELEIEVEKVKMLKWNLL